MSKGMILIYSPTSVFSLRNRWPSKYGGGSTWKLNIYFVHVFYYALSKNIMGNLLYDRRRCEWSDQKRS
jgi:hypothetical protein